MGISLGELWELVMDREAWHAAGSYDCKESDATERLNSTEPRKCLFFFTILLGVGEERGCIWFKDRYEGFPFHLLFVV